MTMNLDFLKPVVDMSGGLNYQASTHTIKDDESPELLNVRCDPLGPIVGRLGTQRQNASGGYEIATGTPIAKPVTSLWRYYHSGGTNVVLATIGDYLVKFDDITNMADVGPLQDLTALTPAQPADKAWEFATFKDWVFMVTETGNMLRTNGTYVEVVGVAATQPNAINPGDFVGAAGWLPNGATVYYVATYVHRDGLGESPVSDVRTATAPGAGGPFDVTVTVPASGKAGGDVIATRLYRELQGGSGTGPFYLVKEAGTDGATFTDDVADASLGAKVDTTRAQPLKAAFITVHHGRLWIGRLTDGSTRYFFDVQFSDFDYPEQWPAEFRLKCHNNKGDTLRGMAPYNGQLYAMSSKRVYPIVGTGIESGSALVPDYRVQAPIVGPGAMSHRVIQEREGVLYTMNKQGMWRTEGDQIVPISRFRVEKWIRTYLDQTRASQAAGVVTAQDYRVSMPSVGGDTTNDLTLIYDFQADAFLPDQGYHISDYMYADEEADAALLYAAEHRNLGYTYRMDYGNQDWDSDTAAYVNITRYFRSKDYSHGREIGETCQYMMLLIDAAVQGKSLKVVIRINRGAFSYAVKTLNLQPGSPLWDAFNWDEAKWATKNQTLHRMGVTQGAVGEWIAVELTQEENQDPFRVEMIAFGGQWRQPRLDPQGGS